MVAVHKTALQWGKPPSFWLGGDGEWTEHDKIFVHAVALYQSSLCPTCGMPKEQCQTEDWDVVTSVCGPEAAVENWRKNNKEAPPGIKVTPVQVGDLDPSESAAAATAPEWLKQKHSF